MSISSGCGIFVLPFANYILNKVLKIIAELNHILTMIAQVGEINLVGLGGFVLGGKLILYHLTYPR